MRTVKAQIVIVGGGIAGLWALRELRRRNYHAVLVEMSALGANQTLASQGMIHGGQRYKLPGKKSKHAALIEPMPAIWSDCLAGKGDVDLSSTKVLSPQQFMWSPGGFGKEGLGFVGSILSFFASKAVKAKTKKLPPEEWPEVFRMTNDFRGQVYKMPEVVLDTKSLLQSLSRPDGDYIHKVTITEIIRGDDKIDRLIGATSDGEQIALEADAFVFAAGTFNEQAAISLGVGKAATQRRPLRQVFVGPLPHRLYAHCIKADPRPRVTVTAHPISEGAYIWYLGGLVAVRGAETSDDEAIDFAKQEMKALFPSIEWDQLQWGTWYGDRAEPAASDGFLPDGPAFTTVANGAIAWPTKLTFAPALGTLVADWVRGIGIEAVPADPFDLPACPVGRYPWEGRTWA